MKKYLFLLIALLYTFSYTLWFRWADGFFFLNRSQIYDKDIMELGSMWLLNLWTSIVGFDILSANILAWLLCVGALVVPYIALQTIEERRNNIYYLAIGILLMGCFTFNLYNPDAPSLFFLSCLSTLLLKYGCIGKYKIVLLGGILTGILMSVRFPNVVALPMVLVYILFKEKGVLNRTKYSLAYSIISLTAYVSIICMLSRRIDFVNYFTASMKEALYLSDEEHGLYTLFHSYVFSLIPIAKKTIILVGATLLALKVKVFAKWYFGLLFSMFIFGFLYFIDGINTVNGFRETFGGCTLALLLAISIFNKKDKNLVADYALLSCFIFVGAAGSDTGLMKIYFFAVVACMIVLLNKDIVNKHKAACIFTICPLVLFSIYSFSAVFFIDHKYESVSKIPNITQFVSNQENCKIQQYYNIGKKNDGNELFMYGHHAHYVYVALEKRPPFLMPFYMKSEDEKLIMLVFEQMSTFNNCVLVDLTNSEIMKQFALDKGLQVNSEGDYCVYEKN